MTPTSLDSRFFFKSNSSALSPDDLVALQVDDSLIRDNAKFLETENRCVKKLIAFALAVPRALWMAVKRFLSMVLNYL